MLILPVSLPLKRVSGSMSSRPPKFLLIACNISNHVGGCLDFSAKENTIFTRLKGRNVDCFLHLLHIFNSTSDCFIMEANSAYHDQTEHMREQTTNELRGMIPINVVCATSKASDQPAPRRSLIRAFACRLDILWLLHYWPNIVRNF